MDMGDSDVTELPPRRPHAIHRDSFADSILSLGTGFNHVLSDFDDVNVQLREIVARREHEGPGMVPETERTTMDAPPSPALTVIPIVL